MQEMHTNNTHTRTHKHTKIHTCTYTHAPTPPQVEDQFSKLKSQVQDMHTNKKALLKSEVRRAQKATNVLNGALSYAKDHSVMKNKVFVCVSLYVWYAT